MRDFPYKSTTVETYVIPGLIAINDNVMYGAIQLLHNAVGGRSVSDLSEKSSTKMYGSTILALRGWEGVEFLEKKVM